MAIPSTVVFFGKRRGALAAARRLGLRVLLLAEKPPGEAARAGLAAYHPFDFAGASGDWAPSDWRALAAELSRRWRVFAVIALVERSVLPAARLRHALGLPGQDVESARRCSDKLIMKRAARRAGLATADFVDAGEGLGGGALVERLGLPLVLKPRVGSGARGTRVLRHRREVPEHLEEGWMAESFVAGREMSCETFVREGRPLFVNPTEYLEPLVSNLVPAALEPEVRRGVEELNAGALAALGVCRGVSHLELFLTAGGPVFGELAARPPGGHLMELLSTAYGFDAWQAWLELELGRAPALPRVRPSRAAALAVLHPGAGTVTSVRGLEEARAMPGVEKLVLRLAPGDAVEPRLGSGQEVGHLLVTGRDRDQAARRLSAARERLRIELLPATAS